MQPAQAPPERSKRPQSAFRATSSTDCPVGSRVANAFNSGPYQVLNASIQCSAERERNTNSQRFTSIDTDLAPNSSASRVSVASTFPAALPMRSSSTARGGGRQPARRWMTRGCALSCAGRVGGRRAWRSDPDQKKCAELWRWGFWLRSTLQWMQPRSIGARRAKLAWIDGFL